MATECFCACCGVATTLTGWPGDACCFASWSALSPPVTGIATTGMVISSAVAPAPGTACAGPGSRFWFFSTQMKIPRQPTQQTRPPTIPPIKITGTAAAELELPPSRAVGAKVGAGMGTAVGAGDGAQSSR